MEYTYEIQEINNYRKFSKITTREPININDSIFVEYESGDYKYNNLCKVINKLFYNEEIILIVDN